MEAIFTRRSIRKYQDKKIEKEKIEKLLKAAMQAPSAWNQQPWEFLVIEDEETLKKLAGASPYAKMVPQAAAAIILLCNLEYTKTSPDYWAQGMSAATENLLLEAVELGLGAVWLGVYPNEDRMEYITELFQLPEDILPFTVIPLGYPEEENMFVDRFDEKRIHYEVW